MARWEIFGLQRRSSRNRAGFLAAYEKGIDKVENKRKRVGEIRESNDRRQRTTQKEAERIHAVSSLSLPKILQASPRANCFWSSLHEHFSLSLSFSLPFFSCSFQLLALSFFHSFFHIPIFPQLFIPHLLILRGEKEEGPTAIRIVEG